MIESHLHRMLLPLLVGAFFVEALIGGEASKNHSAQKSYRVTHFSSEDGLPANRITALAQTEDGYLWIGTWFGLARFDGVRFTVFNRNNTSPMVNDAINALAVDREGTLWVGTANGLLSWRDGTFHSFGQTDRLPGRKIWRLVPSRTGGVWIEGDGKVVHWRGGSGTFVADLNTSQTNTIKSMWGSGDDGLTVVMSSGLKRINEHGEFLKTPDLVSEVFHSSIEGGVIDRQERCWTSTGTRLFRFSNGSWKVLQQSPGSGSHFLYEDRSGNVWVNRGQAGFWRFHEDQAESIILDQRVEQSVECMMEDREGNVWIGTPNGLYQLRSKIIQSFSAADGLPAQECRSVSADLDGAIWVETPGGAARIQDGEVWPFADMPQRVPRMSILAGSQGNLWLGNGHNGVVMVRAGVETNWFWSTKSSGRVSGVTLDSLYLDRAGRVWVGASCGVTWFENGRPMAGWGEFGLPTNSVRSIYQTRDGAMWFGTSQAGIVKWRGGPESGKGKPEASTNRSIQTPPVTSYTTADGLCDNRVFVFHEDSAGILWIGTHNGLSRLKDGQFARFRTEHGLFDNLINWLEEDEFGRFWFSCNRGIFRMDRQELNLVADGKKARANAAVYGTADGMLSPETNGEHQPAGCKDHEGKLWFPTMHGVAVIDPRALKDNLVPPLVVIEEVRADGELVGGNLLQFIATESLPANSTLRLRPGRGRTLQFRYTANAFSDPRRVRFRYRLAGRDREWRDETEERTAYYTDLRPGHYRFELEASNPHGIWTGTPATFAFSLAPKFTQTLWFPIFCALGILGASGVFAVWRLRWQRRVLIAEQNARLEGERARIARDLHDDLGTALTGLALELDVIRRDSQEMPSSSNRLTATAQHTRQLAERMREAVWAVNPRCDTIASLASFIEQQTAQFLKSDGIRGRLEFPDEIPNFHIDSESRHQLILAMREALTNVIRHSAATQVVIKMTFDERILMLQVIDNGCGFNSSPAIGHGLHNMGQRLERIEGRFSYQSGSGNGTTLIFRIPLEIPGESKEKAKP
jgi:signal transduction histidine kinase/ligand-binding sensor domain-containing protein